MRKPEQTPEPSIEEILASIRRIIADDAPSAAPVETFEQDMLQPAVAGERRGRPEPGPRGSDEEVLELTEDFMLAEEAPMVELREPAEPEESSGYDRMEEGGAYRDPYDESFAPRSTGRAAPVSEPQEENEPGPRGMFSAVMAEVQRFAQGSSKAEDTPAPAAKPAPENWGKPDLEALAPTPKPASRPVWSGRHKEMETSRASEEPAPGRPAYTDPQFNRKPSLTSRDSWSQGVQMPVPEAGPAIPFPAETAFAAQSMTQPASAEPSPGTTADPISQGAPAADQAPEPAPAAGSATRKPGSPIGSIAEELADKAVSDFAQDRLSAPPVVADILKSDKPFMEAITSTLADALTRGADEAEEFEEAPPPEDLIEESFGASPRDVGASSKPSAPVAGPKAGPERPVMPEITNLDGGFVAGNPVAAAQPDPALSDPETPELPREDIDDIVGAPQAEQTANPGYRPTSIAEPMMPNLTVPGRSGPRPVPAFPGTREPAMTGERLQPYAGQKTFEETIKEMLKPLLLQWLDENMPRLVKEAIREEIATNGLLPKTGERRR